MKEGKAVRSVTHNFIMNAFLMGSNILFPMLTYPYVSRILMPYGMGQVSFANAVITYFTMFAQLGIPTYGIRVCAKVRDDKEALSRTVHELLVISGITCGLSYAVFFLAVSMNERLRQEKTLFLVMSVAVLFHTIGVEWLYKGLEQYTYITVRSVAFKFLAFAGIFIFVHEKADYIIYGFLTVFALTGSYAMNFLRLRKIIFLRPVGGYRFRRHLKPIFVFFAMSVATTIYTNMDSVMLGFMKGAEENGFYDAAIKIKNILVSLVTSLGTVLLPRVSYYWEKGERETFWRLARTAAAFELLTAGALALFFILYAEPTVYLVSGRLFERSILPMQIIMPTLLLIGLSNITGIQIMIPMGMEKYVLYSEIAGAAVNLAANSMLIPKFGASGAAVGTLLAETLVLLVQLWVLRAHLGRLFGGIQTGKMLAAAAIAAAAGIFVLHGTEGSLLRLLLGGCAYFGLYAIVLAVCRETTFGYCMGKVIGLWKTRLGNRH